MNTFHTVRLHRKRHALSQRELADLLALSQCTISRIEDDHLVSSLETALGLQAIFDTQPRTLFPKLYEKVEEQVMNRASRLDAQVRNQQDPRSRKKQLLLSAMAKRARPNRIGA